MRKVILEKAEALAGKRREAWVKTESALRGVRAKKERIEEGRAKKANKAARTVRKAEENAELAKLLKAVEESGKSLEKSLSLKS